MTPAPASRKRLTVSAAQAPAVKAPAAKESSVGAVKLKAVSEEQAIQGEERILVKEFIQGVVLGLLLGFLIAYLLLA